MRPMTPLQASMASLNMVLPQEAWPTMAKLRMSGGEYFCITYPIVPARPFA